MARSVHVTSVTANEKEISLSDNRTVVVLQPGYLPWLGFFDQMYNADVFVFYDDVQFDKNGWRNRNRIKSAKGPQWLTVPVRIQSLNQRILDVEIDNRAPWVRKQIGTIQQFYSGSAYLKRYLPELQELLHGKWERIADLDIAVVNLMSSWLGIQRQFVRSSELGIEGERSERLLKICLHFGAKRYLSGAAAKDYLNTSLFEQSGIEVVWQDYHHPTYKQQYDGFMPYLSALDLVLNCGDDSLGILTSNMERGTE